MLSRDDIEPSRRLCRPLLVPPRLDLPEGLRRRVSEHNAALAELADLLQQAMDTVTSGRCFDDESLPRRLLATTQQRASLLAEIEHLQHEIG
jgi:hypothetical protein